MSRFPTSFSFTDLGFIFDDWGCSQNEIYDIGTEIIFLQENGRNSTQIEALVTYITPIESSRRALALGSVKTRFKTFWSMLFLKFACALGFAGCVFHELLPPQSGD